MSGVNLQNALSAWTPEIPAWVRLLAEECDRTSQAEVADRLKISNSFVNRIIWRNYGASYAEAKQKVMSIIGGADVNCPAFGPIPLTSCIRNRRRKGPAINTLQRTFERHCPNCHFNSDRNHLENQYDA